MAIFIVHGSSRHFSVSEKMLSALKEIIDWKWTEKESWEAIEKLWCNSSFKSNLPGRKMFLDRRSWKLEMLDFSGQLSIAAGAVADETLSDLTQEGSKQLVHMTTVSY